MALAVSSVPSLVRFGSGTWTDARIPEPRLVGQDVTAPYLSDATNDRPSSAETAPSARSSWSKTPLSS